MANTSDSCPYPLSFLYYINRTLTLFQETMYVVRNIHIPDSLIATRSHVTISSQLDVKIKSIEQSFQKCYHFSDRKRQTPLSCGFYPLPFFLLGVQTWCLETRHPSCHLKDKSHIFRMPEQKARRSPGPWIVARAVALSLDHLSDSCSLRKIKRCLFKPLWSGFYSMQPSTILPDNRC